jgi:hypothetical protein
MAATNVVKGAETPEYRQVIKPSYVKGTYTADDTDNHDFRADGRGKGRYTVQVDNPSNRVVTLDVYGAPDITAEVGDADVLQIGSQQSVSTTSGIYETVNDPFPFYLFRLTSSVTGDSTTISLYVHFSAF